MLRRIIANPRLLRPVTYRAYSSAGYGNATTQHKNSEEPPLDIEDPQELHSTPPQHNNNDAQHQQSTQASDYKPSPKSKEEIAKDESLKKQRRGFKRGDREAMREYSQGCD